LNTAVEQETNRVEIPLASGWKQEPTLKEAILLWFVVAVIFVATVSILRPYMPLVRGYGDVGSYVRIAHAIRTWDFLGTAGETFLGPAILDGPPVEADRTP
jgi:hypothetical protein